MSMEKIIVLAREQIDHKAEELKREVCERLTQQADDLKSQLESLSELLLPETLISAVLEQDAKVWVSKVVGVPQRDSLSVSVRSKNLFFERAQSRDPSFGLEPGFYRLMLLAFPQVVAPDKHGLGEDGYGSKFSLGEGGHQIE